MVDVDVPWPSLQGDLCLGDHMLWKFSPKTLHSFELIVKSKEHPKSHKRTLNNVYVPVLACLDLEYWKTMDMDDEEMNPLELRRNCMHKKYMHTVRHAFVADIFAADAEKLKDGSWGLGVARSWSIRTWNKHSSSENGRSAYLQHCQRLGKIPYAQKLTTERRYSDNMVVIGLLIANCIDSDWRIYFQGRANQYTLHEYVARKSYEESIRYKFRPRQFPALYWLRAQGFLPWPEIDMRTVQDNAAHKGVLEMREQEVSHF